MTAFVGASLDATYTAAQLVGAESGKCPGIGDIYVSHDNKTYRFVQYNAGAGAVAAVAGNAVGFYAPAGVSTGQTNIVTSDVSDTAANGAGILAGAPASGSYGWIQVKGAAVVTTAFVGTPADGQALALSVTTDGTFKVAAAVTETICAYCIDFGTKTVMLAGPY